MHSGSATQPLTLLPPSTLRNRSAHFTLLFTLGELAAARQNMMAGFMSYFGGRRDPKQSSRDAIVTLRQQLQMLEKKEEHLQRKIDEDMKKARANAVSNKAGALPYLPLSIA